MKYLSILWSCISLAKRVYQVYSGAENFDYLLPDLNQDGIRVKITVETTAQAAEE